jgi:N-dimethylarginine dimethylaminohydrolase
MLTFPFRGLLVGGCAVGTPSAAMAASGRSDERSHKWLEETFHFPVVTLRLGWNHVYHIDLALAELPDGQVMICKEGFHPKEYEKARVELFERFGLPEKEFLIPVSYEDMMNGACNTRVVDRTVPIPRACSDELKDRVRSHHYDVPEPDMTYHQKGGGFIDCSTNRLNPVLTPGGNAARLGIVRKPDGLTLT